MDTEQKPYLSCGRDNSGAAESPPRRNWQITAARVSGSIFWRRRARLSLNTALLKVVVEGLKQAPKLNSALTFDPLSGSGSLETFEEISIDIPWLLPNGSMLPLTAFNLKKSSLRELASRIGEIRKKVTKADFSLLRKAAAGENCSLSEAGLLPKDIAGGTVTVSNLGSICQANGAAALLEILPPQVFVVGIGALQEKPGVFLSEAGEKAIGIRKFLPMCLAFDHRAFDFGDIVPFLQRLEEIFQAPEEMLHW